MPEKALIIVPCYNEEARLNMEAFKSFSGNYAFLFVNDGSTDGTAALITSYCNERIYLFNMPQNSGKSEAVRQGFIHGLTLPLVAHIEWMGFWDADLATPLEELDKFFLFRQHFCADAQVIIGSRIRRLGSSVKRTFWRHILGRVFATVADSLFHLKCYDTQCGAKLFHTSIVPQFIAEPFISQWAFDVELLTRIKHHKMVEYPLSDWQDVAGSKLKVSRVAFKVLRDFYLMNKKYNNR
ncbi:N/A [soil metagenome]